jgi:hypothetical protein
MHQRKAGLLPFGGGSSRGRATGPVKQSENKRDLASMKNPKKFANLSRARKVVGVQALEACFAKESRSFANHSRIRPSPSVVTTADSRGQRKVPSPLRARRPAPEQLPARSSRRSDVKAGGSAGASAARRKHRPREVIVDIQDCSRRSVAHIASNVNAKIAQGNP